MASFTAEHEASFEKALQNAQIVAIVQQLLGRSEIFEKYQEMPFVCIIDAPSLGTTRAVGGVGFLSKFKCCIGYYCFCRYHRCSFTVHMAASLQNLSRFSIEGQAK